MNFGIAILIVLAVWALLSIAVSVTIGGVAGFRDDEHALPRVVAGRDFVEPLRDHERVAS